MPTTADAWFIYAGSRAARGEPAEFVRETWRVPDLEADEVLVEPLYGAWEANMQNALEGVPIDVIAERGEEKAIIGNAGSARVLQVGPEVRHLREGQTVFMFGMKTDAFGYPKRVMGYDARLTGFLTTRLKIREEDVFPIPEDTQYSLKQWAAFNNRYVTAWANWRVAYGTFRLLLTEEEFPRLNVWSWGGGTSLAEVQLATLLGHRGVALSSRPERLELLRAHGVEAVDRRPFADLDFDEARFKKDPEAAEAYRLAEETFLATVRERTEGQGVQIFVDMLGAPVFRATTKALSRHGVLTTSGWKAGMRLWYLRALETIQRHQFVHTHYARRREAEDAVAFAEARGWMPIVDERVYSFDEVPELARDYAAGKFRMFPIYRVCAE